jgi:hypothetical protein
MIRKNEKFSTTENEGSKVMAINFETKQKFG